MNISSSKWYVMYSEGRHADWRMKRLLRKRKRPTSPPRKKPPPRVDLPPPHVSTVLPTGIYVVFVFTKPISKIIWSVIMIMTSKLLRHRPNPDESGATLLRYSFSSLALSSICLPDLQLNSVGREKQIGQTMRAGWGPSKISPFSFFYSLLLLSTKSPLLPFLSMSMIFSNEWIRGIDPL